MTPIISNNMTTEVLWSIAKLVGKNSLYRSMELDPALLTSGSLTPIL
ncbi:MAG: hypothetical protein CM1200mP14_08410 [Gammaproteobacteria bacterium]|nr:MAG: hypothetical protein CM1200mP14_08410 [Gammaproteobacteria bacterium]